MAQNGFSRERPSVRNSNPFDYAFKVCHYYFFNLFLKSLTSSLTLLFGINKKAKTGPKKNKSYISRVNIKTHAK